MKKREYRFWIVDIQLMDERELKWIAVDNKMIDTEDPEGIHDQTREGFVRFVKDR